MQFNVLAENTNFCKRVPLVVQNIILVQKNNLENKLVQKTIMSCFKQGVK